MSILHAAPALVESAPSDWSARFDRAQQEFRRRNGKPVAADPLDLGNLDCYANGWDAEIAKARLAKIDASMAETERMLDERDGGRGGDRLFSDQMIETIARACNECNPSDEPADFSTDERWDEVWTTTEEVEAPAKPTAADLLKPVTIFPLNHPTRKADADDLDRAHEVGYQLGSEGWTARDVAPASHWTASECDHFIMGLEAGRDRLMNDMARDLDELAAREAVMDAYDFPLAEINEAELAECGSVVGHAG